MMRGLLLALLLGWAFAAQAVNFWDKLWLTPDQRGERLLHRGDLDEAAKTFRDPRRRAYAELKAGNYLQAAHDLAKSDNSDDLYNRGNALARAGKLQEAIQSYDAALRRDPHNHDAQHNRDLVEKVLKKQQQQHKPSHGENSFPGKHGNSKNKRGNAKNSTAQNQADQKQTGEKQSGRSAQGKQAGSNPEQQHSQEQKAARPQPAEPSNAGKQQAGQAAQARRDATAGPTSTQAMQKQAKTAQASTPISEQQLSQQQWLRQIPDDPGGLLRRKFMIEHMLRQREAQQ